MLRAGRRPGIQNPVRPLLAWRHDSPPQPQTYSANNGVNQCYD
jgi:hypothetical protein